MKYRQGIVTQMTILASLFSSPKGPTRLAQSCNIHFARLEAYTKGLESKGLIRSEAADGKVVFSITEEGYRLYSDWLEIWKRLPDA